MYKLYFQHDHFRVDRTVCKLMVFRNHRPEPTKNPTSEFIVFFGERADNPGASVTNLIEKLAQTVHESLIKPLGISLEEVRWVECNPIETERPDMVTFRIISIDYFDDPHWTPVDLKNPFLKKEAVQNGRV